MRLLSTGKRRFFLRWGESSLNAAQRKLVSKSEPIAPHHLAQLSRRKNPDDYSTIGSSDEDECNESASGRDECDPMASALEYAVYLDKHVWEDYDCRKMALRNSGKVMGERTWNDASKKRCVTHSQVQSVHDRQSTLDTYDRTAKGISVESSLFEAHGSARPITDANNFGERDCSSDKLLLRESLTTDDSKLKVHQPAVHKQRGSFSRPIDRTSSSSKACVSLPDENCTASPDALEKAIQAVQRIDTKKSKQLDLPLVATFTQAAVSSAAEDTRRLRQPANRHLPDRSESNISEHQSQVYEAVEKPLHLTACKDIDIMSCRDKNSSEPRLDSSPKLDYISSCSEIEGEDSDTEAYRPSEEEPVSPLGTRFLSDGYPFSKTSSGLSYFEGANLLACGNAGTEYPEIDDFYECFPRLHDSSVASTSSIKDDISGSGSACSSASTKNPSFRRRKGSVMNDTKEVIQRYRADSLKREKGRSVATSYALRYLRTRKQRKSRAREPEPSDIPTAVYLPPTPRKHKTSKPPASTLRCSSVEAARQEKTHTHDFVEDVELLSQFTLRQKNRRSSTTEQLY